jgi:hypothetical protein
MYIRVCVCVCVCVCVSYTYPNRINAILDMCDERIVERAHDMEDAVYRLDVRQKRVA